MLRSSAVVATFLLAGCSSPRFAATRTEEFEIPEAGVQRLVCESHNGGIVVVGDDAAVPIRLRAEITARAASQLEADALLHELHVRREVVDGRLEVAGQAPSSGWTTSHSFAFTITLPTRIAAELTSHNGAIRVQGLSGDLRAESHNGELVVDTATASLGLTTHNGDIRLSLRGALREATVETHNGEVTVDCDPPARGQVEVETHNGSITWPGRTDVDSRRRRIETRLGDGAGKLRVTTHNGDVVLR